MRSTFYRLAMIAGQGGARLPRRARSASAPATWRFAWSIVFVRAGGAFVALVALAPLRAAAPGRRPRRSARRTRSLRGFVETFAVVLRKPRHRASILAFLLLFRFGEAQALKLVTPFLLDPAAKGGLGPDDLAGRHRLRHRRRDRAHARRPARRLRRSRALGLQALAVADGASRCTCRTSCSSTSPTRSRRTS